MHLDIFQKEAEDMANKDHNRKQSDQATKYAAKKRQRHIWITAMFVCAVVMLGIGLWLAVGQGSGASSDAGVYYADIEIEDYGTITVKLDAESAPITTENFVKLAREGFYDGLTFHRIIEGFMMQGGDPEADGTGGSSEKIKGEFTANGVNNPLSHTRGAISMARSQKMDSASSQFFIVHQDSLHLDGQYAVFGYVTEGMDVVDAVCEAAEPTDNNGTISRDQQPVIVSVTIRTE